MRYLKHRKGSKEVGPSVVGDRRAGGGAKGIRNGFRHPAALGSRIPAASGEPDVPAPESRDGVTCLADAALPTRYGEFRIKILRVDDLGAEAIVLCRGRTAGEAPILTRVHSECLTSEVLGSLRCDCAEQLAAALGRIGAADRGVLIYLRQEGRGIGLVNKIRAYALQDRGLDTVDANLALGLPVDGREYFSAAKVLTFLGARRIRLLTNNPAKARALQRQGIEVVERVPLEVAPNPINRTYLRAKASRLGHLLTLDLSEALDEASPLDAASPPEAKTA